MLDAAAPSKKTKNVYLATTESLLQLQSSVSKMIPDLVPSSCTSYSLKRLHTANNFSVQNFCQETAPYANLCQRTFTVKGVFVPFPENRKQYSCPEACSVIVSFDEVKRGFKVKQAVSSNKVINAMIVYKLPSSDSSTPLIPYGQSAMFRHHEKYMGVRMCRGP